MGYLDDLGDAGETYATGGLNQIARLGGGLNNIVSLGASGKASDLAGSIGDAYNGLTPPDVEQMKLQLQQLVEQGTITPEQAQTYLQGDSSLNGITLDPKLQKAQMDALGSLQDIGQNKGLTDMDRAQLAQIQSGEDTATRGQREAIIQNAQQRGLGGSGIELLSQMQNQQDSATRKSARDTDVAGMAQQRALSALQSAGQLGGNIANQSFNQQATVANANDAINKFNTQNQQQVGLANTATNNAAQAANLAAKQKIADANTQMQNQQQQYNKELGQKDFQNQTTIAQGKSGAATTQANLANQEAQGNKQLFGSILGAGATAAASDERLKKDVKDFNASEFLDSITPSKYRYKEPSKFGEGVHASPMAQDLEKTDVGRAMVEDTPDGKMVNYGHGFGTILAALTDVHNRLKEVEGKHGK